MSFYTVFDVAESLITSTTTATATLVNTDAVLVHNVSSGKKFQSTIGQMGSMQAVSTSSSTGTLLPPYGTSFLQMGTAGTSATVFILADPPSKGLVKTVWFTSTTSTGNLVTCQGTGTFIYTTGANTANSFNVQGSGAGGVQLVAVSTAQWVLTGKYGTVATTLTTV